MASRKTAPLDGGLIARKGEAAPAIAGTERQDPIAVTVKLEPELYVRLKRYNMRTTPMRTAQKTLVEALTRLLDDAGV